MKESSKISVSLKILSDCSRFRKFLWISKDFIGFRGIFQSEQGFVGFLGLSKDFRISFRFLSLVCKASTHDTPLARRFFLV